MISTQAVGKKGELEAAQFLKTKGFEILEQNFRCRTGEIDIVCRDEDEIVFVEVKTRINSIFGEGLESVNAKKQMKMIKTAQYYLRLHGQENQAYRFDVISILANVNRIDHLEYAF